jgi:hypothetical protein
MRDPLRLYRYLENIPYKAPLCGIQSPRWSRSSPDAGGIGPVFDKYAWRALATQLYFLYCEATLRKR